MSELSHFGVKGMRWGVRRQPKAIRTGRVTPPRVSKEDETKLKSRLKNAAYNAIPDYKKSSNKDLERAIKRLSLEKKYRELSRNALTNLGKKTAGDLLGTAITKKLKPKLGD